MFRLDGWNTDLNTLVSLLSLEVTEREISTNALSELSVVNDQHQYASLRVVLVVSVGSIPALLDDVMLAKRDFKLLVNSGILLPCKTCVLPNSWINRPNVATCAREICMAVCNGLVDCDDRPRKLRSRVCWTKRLDVIGLLVVVVVVCTGNTLISSCADETRDANFNSVVGCNHSRTTVVGCLRRRSKGVVQHQTQFVR